MMKTIIIFNSVNTKYADKKAFSGKSAKDLCNDYAAKLGYEKFEIQPDNATALVNQLAQIAEKEKADSVIYSYNDCPFINVELTKEILQTHQEFKAEYTFADGYPYGFAPEVIDTGTLKILAQLIKDEQTQRKLERDTLFELIKTDINSFDVESVLAPEDWRLYRFAFHCGKKDNFLQCTALFNALEGKIDGANPSKMAETASKTVNCLKTVPGFYNLQIAGTQKEKCIYLPEVEKTEEMSFEKFEQLIQKIADFSEEAVVSFSAWGEAFENKDCIKMIEKTVSYEGLTVFIETNGQLITEDICNKLEPLVKNGKVIIVVKIDAFTADTYNKIHNCQGNEAFTKAVEAVKKLNAIMPGNVYPQFVRIKENEEELESFYRYWNEKENPSSGKLIIQKYDDFAGLLPQRKVADLSPIERNVCWHLRRDFTILSTGEVPPCRACVFSNSVGNAFTQSLEEIWKKMDNILNEHINQNYNKMCGKCDEFYTFNF